MTIEEAIKDIKEKIYNLLSVEKSLDMAIKALEKQIPKKPFQPFGTHSFKCSNCWQFVANEVDDNFDLANLAEWCPYCGQKN